MRGQVLYREEMVEGGGDGGGIILPLLLHIIGVEHFSPWVVGNPLAELLNGGLF